ncbi:choice-of-anchor A family protein [Roseibacillus ishigakijimensis]|uniref:Choice-of-anchor A family protein n=1 Tax=Roseibacillus ishigakijimensis TaxID=454146 RepID=A0A934RLZ2_9BACT|nr:choice-of-anchor A family protein [Roseibacillus ishigakijimensis]MBK1833834.1 choice-of-anchor A family protein [Roseibacillus ishigakijimensis]
MKTTTPSKTMTPLRKTAICLSAIGCALATAVEGASLSQAAPYNVFTFGDLTLTNVDSEGRVAVGGQANLTNFGIGSTFQGRAASAGDSLIVAGNLNYRGGEVHYGNAYYGGNLISAPAIPNGTLNQGNPLDFASAQSHLTRSSTYWSGLTANGATNDNYGGINLIGTDPDLNIFEVSGQMLSSAWGVTIDAPAGSTVLVNVNGADNQFKNLGISFSDINGDNTGTTNREHVLYNFFESSTLRIESISVQGSLLAPHADVAFNNGNLEGNLIANTVTGTGEAHDYLFEGTLPEETPVLPPISGRSLPFPGEGESAVPEPSTALLSALFGSLALLNRRRS